MSLGKVQSQMVGHLVEIGVLTQAQADLLATRPEDLSGSALDRLLQSEYKVTPLQSQAALGRALGLSPVNVGRLRLTPATFERIPVEFCERNLVLPVGELGDILLVAVANPFDDALPGKLHDLTRRRVVRLLSREKDIKDKFAKGRQGTGGFAEVVRQIATPPHSY